MAGKKKKGRKKKKRGFPKALIAVWALVLAGFAGLWLCMNSQDQSGTAGRVVYEEFHKTIPRLDQLIRSVDRAIYDSLYRYQIPEKDIHFIEVRSRHNREHHWESTELLVACPDRGRAGKLAATIENALGTLAPSVEFRRADRRDGTVHYRISSLGLETHGLMLSRDRPGRAAEKRPRAAIIIDDLGHDPKIASSFMNMSLPFTLAVLPDAPFSRGIAREALKKGFELLLHLPMEPKGYPSVQPGSGALLVGMDDREIRDSLISLLDKIPGIAGVNNHMGSLFTEDRRGMGVVLKELKRRHLFFVDSRTTCRTVAYEMALDMGVPSASRSVFLDNDLSSGAIRIQIDRLRGLSRHSGSAVGIGHPFVETLEMLRKSAPSMRPELDLVPVSELLS